MQDVDSIGVVRETRRLRAKGQRERLQADGCRAIFEIGSKAKQFSRNELEKLVRQGTIIKLVHLYLLADPKALRKKGGCRADLLACMKRIEKRGGVLADLDSGLSTSSTEQRYELIALATEQIARGGRVSRGGKMGRPPQTWTEEEWAKARAVWESRKLKTWGDVRTQLPRGMSLARAYKQFGARTQALARQVNSDGHVYFLTNGRRRRVKIGFSSNYKTRCSDIQTSTPDKLRIVGLLAGKQALETEMKRRFAEYRVRGEWFRIEGDLAAFMRTLPKPPKS